MAKLAFCGLGLMGAPMARRLLDAGHRVTVWNRTAARAEALRDHGAAVAATPGEAARGAEAAITMLADPDALEAVVFGPHGLLEGLASGSALIDMSTVGPGTIRRLAERLPRGIELLDAPVRGSVPAATEGSLRIVVGGSNEGFRRWEPVLEALGTPTHAGPTGTGAAMKLVNNLAVIGATVSLAEALALADGFGLDQSLVMDMLSSSPVAAVAANLREKVEGGEFPAAFRLSLAAKDVRLATEEGDAAGVDLRVAPASRSLLESADRAGWGDSDYTAVSAFVRGTGSAMAARASRRAERERS